LRSRRLIITGFALAALACAQAAQASTGIGGGSGGGSASGGSSPRGQSTASGGSAFTPPPPGVSTPTHPIVRGFRARIIDGLAYAPSYAPIQVKRAIWAGDRIRHKPYIYGGGHAAWTAAGYDCSGAVSYVLHAAGLLGQPLDSTGFESWGRSGLGRWITVWTNAGHAFIQIAGIRFDTSSLDDPNPPPGTGPRWRPFIRDPQGFMARHPAGL
jgi:hypothetical protein